MTVLLAVFFNSHSEESNIHAGRILIFDPLRDQFGLSRYCERVIKAKTLLKILTCMKYAPVFPVRLGLADAFSLRNPFPNFQADDMLLISPGPCQVAGGPPVVHVPMHYPPR